jgi:hypothetical protein
MKHLKAHARFLIVMVVLAVVLFVANGQLTTIDQSLRARQTAAQSLLAANYTALFVDTVKYGEPATIHGRKLQDKTMLTSAVTDIVNDRMEFETDPAFTVEALPTGKREPDDMVEYYRKKVLDLQDELGFKRYFGPGVRTEGAFGFREGEDLRSSELGKKEETVRQYLRQLDIARTVAFSAERTGVSLLEKLNFSAAVGQSLSQRGVPTVSTTQGEQPYLQGLGLEIDILANEQALYNFMIDLQRPEKGGLRNRYLAIESFKLEKPDLLDPKDDRIKARIVVVAYRVNRDSSYPPDASQTGPAQPVSGPRKFRR